MSEQLAQKQGYAVSIEEPEGGGSTLTFRFNPLDALKRANSSKMTRPFAVGVRQKSDGFTLEWGAVADDPDVDREEIEAEIAARMADRQTWQYRVAELVGQVETWCNELGWSTRRIEKRLDDLRIGKHRVPALLMQQETCRALLEPVGRSTPGIDGMVDLYLMPSYDDIANLYYYDGKWNVHYGELATEEPQWIMVEPLSKATLEKVLTEMRKNAA